MTNRRRPTATSSFGVGRRESHDASAFYDRFSLPQVSRDDTIEQNSPEVLDSIFRGDARNMTDVRSNSVALVVTSPPYFAGKEYEQALGEGHVPRDYLDYLHMLEDVFAECRRVLEPGGRVAVNVANLGRKPYRSLSADVVTILQDRLGMLLRGEVVWLKGQGASGSCAWGSFQSPANPVLRDLTERIVIASKGRFDRALSRRERARRGLPFEATIFKDDFMDATTDVWEILPESAQRVGHPAPFPPELPERLMHLFTYRGDVVLDPFMGSGSSAVAAVRAGRYFIGYDTDPHYVAAARARVAMQQQRNTEDADTRQQVVVGLSPNEDEAGGTLVAAAVRAGRRAKEVARALLQDCGFEILDEDHRLPGGVEVSFVCRGTSGVPLLVDVVGAFTTTRSGLRKTDLLWRAVAKASLVQLAHDGPPRLLFLTTQLPPQNSPGGHALRAAFGKTFLDAVELLTPEGHERLRAHARGQADALDLGLPRAEDA